MDAPQPILGQRSVHRRGWPLHDTQANRTIEQLAARALPPHTLMQRAGVVVAALVQAQWPHAQSVTILVGPGNNGGDGLAAALHLQRAGYQVVCRVCLASNATLAEHVWPADAAASLAQARQENVIILEHGADAWADPPPDVIVDALLGRGLTRPAEGAIKAAIEWAEHCRTFGSRVLAVDLPSGLPANTGSPHGSSRYLCADVTLCLLSLAPGLFTADGRDIAGDIWWHGLGTRTEALPCAWLVSRPQLTSRWPRRAHRQHKGSFGDVLIIGGAPGMAGAALLAGRAALFSGAGRVYLGQIGPSGGPGVPCAGDPAWPELMTCDLRSPCDGSPVDFACSSPRWSDATLVAGCGGGVEIAPLMPSLLASTNRLVLDADALNAIAADAALQNALRQRKSRGGETVLTPHPLEAARLLGCTIGVVQANRISAARQLAQQFDCVVVLKGSGTLVSISPHPDSASPSTVSNAEALGTWIIPVGNAALSTAGSGDVLAGLIGSLWSQLAMTRGESPAREADQGAASDRGAGGGEARHTIARLACAGAVYLHGETAERCSPGAASLPASQLAEGLQGCSLSYERTGNT